VAVILEDMRKSADDPEQLIQHDIAFHRAVIAATGNETLTSLLDGLSGRTVRARVWRGRVDADAARVTVDEHARIYRALRSRDQPLAYASALIHVNTSESWLRTVLAEQRSTDAT
jgi:GntR family transcriptional repressor for pyruvate dehydrogenase complex